MTEALQYLFVQHALLAALLASIACGITGAYIVARRMVFISGGITHASFGGIGIGYFLGIHPIIGGAVFSVLSAVGIRAVSKRASIREDSAIGILWSLGMAVGIVFVYLTPGYAPNLMSYLFGSILTVTPSDLWLMGGITLLTVFVFTYYYRLILYVSFDEEYARSHRIPVETINYLMLALVALVIVINIRVAGIILVISYLTIPQSTANLFVRKLSDIMLWSIAISFIGSITGLWISYLTNIPSGASIILVFVLMFGIARLATYLKNSRRLG